MRGMHLLKTIAVFSCLLTPHIGSASLTKEEYIEKLGFAVGESWGMRRLTMAGCETLDPETSSSLAMRPFTEELMNTYFFFVARLKKSPENQASQIFEQAQKKIKSIQNLVQEAYVACQQKLLSDRKLLFGQYLTSVFDAYFVPGTFGNVYQEPKVFSSDFANVLDKELTKHLIGLGGGYDDTDVYGFFKNVIEYLFQVRNRKFPTSPVVIFREYAGTIYNTRTPEGFAQNMIFHERLKNAKNEAERMMWRDLMIEGTEEIIQIIKEDFASTKDVKTVNNDIWYTLYPAADQTLNDLLSPSQLAWLSEQTHQKETDSFTFLSNKMGEKNTYIWFDDMRYKLAIPNGTEILEFGKNYDAIEYSDNQSFLKHPFLTGERVKNVLSDYHITEKPLPYLVVWGGNPHISPHIPNEFQNLVTTLANQYPTVSELTSIHAIGKPRPFSSDTRYSMLDSGVIKRQISSMMFDDLADFLGINPDHEKEHPIAALHGTLYSFRAHLSYFKSQEFVSDYKNQLQSLDQFLEDIRSHIIGLGTYKKTQKVFNNVEEIIPIEKALLDGVKKGGDLSNNTRYLITALELLIERTEFWANQNFEKDIWPKVLTLHYIARGMNNLAAESGYLFYLKHVHRYWPLPDNFTIKTLSDEFVNHEPAFLLIMGAMLSNISFSDPEIRNVQKKLTSKILNGIADKKGLYIYNPAPATEAQKVTVLTNFDFFGN